MFRIVALLSVLAIVMANEVHDHDFQCCSTEDRQEMQALWHEIWSAQFTGRRVQVAVSVFEDLFEREPDAKNLFKRVNVDDLQSPEFKAHCIRVVNGLDTAISLLDDPFVMLHQLEHLGKQHQTREGVKKEHFALMARSYLKVMPQVSSCFNADAWSRCFDGIAHKISSYLAA
ncbi:hypothetical protein LSH36_281g10083 [Paralvinella palmiformis]|uniref:Extracellular globin n=5 Tax=Bilateria TaxID=33213 RepID=A0AAD9N4G3_9ANNE|nr:hypothetical protein LSH36_281g10083 [Paralvinella palmiformis]